MSGPRRFFVSGEISGEMEIRGEEYTHAIKILRKTVGDEIILCNGNGLEYRAVINKVLKDSFICRVVSESVNDAEPKTKVALVCGFLKGDKTELVCREAVELGVSEIAVFSSDFSSAYMNENKLARLNKVCVEAAKQCGRSMAVKVKYFNDFSSAIQEYGSYDNKLFACEFENGQRQKLTVENGSVAIVIGSEGGFSDKESALAIEKGFKSVNLGKRILRADTACTTALSIIMYLVGELQ